MREEPKLHRPRAARGGWPCLPDVQVLMALTNQTSRMCQDFPDLDIFWERVKTTPTANPSLHSTVTGWGTVSKCACPAVMLVYCPCPHPRCVPVQFPTCYSFVFVAQKCKCLFPFGTQIWPSKALLCATRLVNSTWLSETSSLGSLTGLENQTCLKGLY